MVKYYSKEGGQLRVLDAPEHACWVNISPPFTPEELEEIAQQFDIPFDFLTDPLDIDERPRYERDEDKRLIILSSPIVNPFEEDIDAIFITVPLGIIITPDHVITITSQQSPVLGLFLDTKVKNFDPEDEQLFVLQILEQTVYRFLNCLKQLNQKRNLIEKELYHSSRNQELKNLLSIEKSLVYFVSSLSDNELLKMKMKRIDFLGVGKDEEKLELFEDIIIDNSQAQQMANMYTNILNGTMDAYGSIISNNLNLTIKRLTVITIVLMVPTLVASFMGMNVALPFAEQSNYAFFIILFISLAFSLILSWYFQRKKLF
ncbi:MAG: magnesium transporter CorA family protein [Saprospiraceae bacterium]|nr:magnesium transporter CorA family protein [Saprospiraceae bacterium]MCF8249679.1 magnesium transporter CorA family protein [Saprospiraceae bacterium]MCF8279838.1 magnesium transporter CorA family protein [Bacteroidales bacterium]MCF8312334.1 magnesium transporter CorA family protein [Saprospiraceae bacterium]MCF8440669.1 magnesium transporter CorA family protein [Saprospiraceae bacterium]